MSLTNRAVIKNRNVSVMSGIDKHITTSMAIGGTTYTPGELKAVFQTQNTALDTADAQRKAWADGVQAARAAGTKGNTTFLLLRSVLIGQYGKSANVVLNDFGMQAPKPSGPKTVDVKATGIAKRAATRTARHTMGKVQKQAIKGSVVGLTVTPITAGPPLPAPVKPT